MNMIEETIDATLDLNGQLTLSQPPHVPPGAVQVTIRAATLPRPQRGLADVIREIAADQRARGFPGRSSEEIRAEEEACQAEDTERDRQLDAARGTARPRAIG